VAQQFRLPKVILVEGVDDQYFFEALVGALGIPDVQVINVMGRDNLRPFIKQIPSSPGFAQITHLLIVRDSDTNPQGAFQSLAGALQVAQLPRPQAPDVAAPGPPAVTISLLPDSATAGDLEDLCMASVAGDPATACVTAYFQCLTQVLQQMPSPMSKARAHAFLASRDVPHKRVGEAALMDYWPLAAPAFAGLRGIVAAALA